MSFNGSKETGIVWILLVLIFHIIHASERLYNFKYQAVEILIGEDDGITSAPPLPIPLPFCKQKTTSSIYVCTNGIIAFGEEYCPFEVEKFGDEFATTNPVIAPFYSDITLAPASFAIDSGNIKSALHLWGNSSNEIFERANNDVQYFLNGNAFDSVLVYIATWSGVRAWGAKEQATFQVAIITDGLRSFVRFSYQDMLWQSVLKNVQVGFKLDDSRDCEKVLNISITGYDPFTYPLDKVKGNTGENGIWMFEITKDKFPVSDLKSITVTVLALGKVLVKTGERVFLFCHLSKNSNIRYLWYKNGALLEKEHKSMIVKDFTLNDAGRYQCKISNLNDVQSSINSIAISVVFSDIPTLSFLPQSFSPVNSSVILSCDIKACPKPVISWHKDGIFLKEGVTPLLVIPTTALSHAGSYQCIATSVNGRIASEAKHFDITSSTSKVSHGSITVDEVNVTFTCIQEKSVKLLLTWAKKLNLNSSEPVVYFADVTIKSMNSGEYVCEVVQENQHEISIFLQLFEEAIVSSSKNNITNSIQDIHFSCAKQPFNSISHKWNITFYGLFVWEGVKYNVKSSFFQDSKAGKCTASFSDGDNKTKSIDIVIKYLSTPQIQLSNNGTLSEGETLSMVCVVEGNPHINFKWWKDGFFLKYNSSNIKLTIYRNDSGLYKCKVENDAGSKFSNGYLLNVTYLNEPDLIIQTGSSFVIEGSNLTFQCISSGSSRLSYLWLKDNKVLNTTNEFLNFKTVSRFDEGNYQCQVSNSVIKKLTEKKFLKVAYLEQPFIWSSHNLSSLIFGHKLILICNSSGSPKIVYKWFKNGEVLSNNKELTIESVDEKTEGSYVCNVSNGYMATSSIVYLNAHYIKTLQLRLLTNETVKEGDSLSMVCEVEDSSPIHIRWWKDGRYLNHTSSMIVFNVNRNDSGVYKCLAENKAGLKISNEQFVDIMYLDNPSIIIQHDSSIPVEGNSMAIQCKSAGSLPLSFMWLKDDMLLNNTNEFLRFEKVMRYDKGKYQCKVSNPAASKFTNVILIDVAYLDSPYINSSHNLSSLTEGVQLILTCNAISSLEISYYWSRNGETISSNRELLFKSIDKTMEGNYTCNVSNGYIKTSASVHLSVSYISTPQLRLSNNETVKEGDSLYMFCDVESTPPVSIKWWKDGIYLNYTSFTIMFKVNRNSSGVYKCLAENKAGLKISNGILLNVMYLDQPLISSSHNLSSLIFGRQLSIICEALGYPIVVYQWLKNEEKVSNSEKLIFESVNENTQGSYICEASNGYIRKSSSVYLGTQYIKTPQLRFSNAETIIEGDSLSMFCEVESTPPVYFKWWKNGHLLNHSSSTIILKVNRNDSGIYKCQAENDAGIRLSNEHPLNVMYMDQPVISKLTSKYFEGDSLLISCSANANPPRSNSSYSWKSNGQFIAHGAYLNLKNVTKKDSGVYECLVRNSVGVSKGEIIDIQYLDEPNLVVQQGSIVMEGNNLILHCISSGSLPLSYIWIKDNVMLNYTNEYLQFHAITRHEQGKYQCKVSNHVTSKLSPVRHIEVVYLEQPFITMSQDPSMLTEGHQLRLICDAPGSIKVDYQWIKNNEVISNNKELFFERFNKNAAGNYVCNVSNGYIRKISFVQLVAHFVGVPTLEFFPSSSVIEGTSLFIMCHENSSDSVNYTWYRDGNKLSKSSKYMYMVASRNISGIYICETSNKYSSKISKGQYLDVFYLSSPFISEEKLVIYQNQSTNVSCSSNSYPGIVYTWKKNGRVVSQSSLLVISNANFDSAGVYECYVENVVGQKMAAITVELQYLEKPKISVYPSAVLLEGNSLLLTCTAIGSGKLRYFWATDGVIFAKESPYKFLENLNRYDKSKVSCIVKNDRESKTSDELTLDIFYLDRPMIKSSVELDFIKLNCTSNGNPPPNFAWYHLGVFISNQSILEISKLNVSEYICVVKNNVGEKSVSTVGTIYTSRRVVKPLLKVLPSISPKEEDFVVMFCETDDSKSIRFEWFKEKLKLPGNSQIMLINKVNRTDSGSYQCKVLYDQDIAFSAAVHIVVQYLDEPLIKLSPPAQFIMAGDNVEMKCISSAEEVLNFYWYHNNKIISNSSILNLEATTVKSEGEYVCEVSGELGSKKSSKSIKIHYMYKPSVQFVPSTSILEGNTVVMICHENSSDSVKYTWYKDNKVIGESKLLSIVFTKRTDNVLYKCQTSNRYASEFSSDYKLNINYLDKPIITELDMLDSIAFNCSAEGNPTPNYTWLYQGVVVSNKTQLVVSSLNDSYVCSVSNKVAHYSVSTIIKEKASNSLLLSVMPSDFIEEGSTVIMTCEVDGSRPVKYLWYKNSTLLAGNSLMKVFVKVSRIDNGIYQCAALYNRGMKYSNEIFMKVEYLEEPVITLSNPNNLLFINDSIQLSCSSLASSAIAYQWKFGAKTLSKSSVLELNNIKKEDSGEYVCETFANRGLMRNTSKVIIVRYLDEPLLTASPSSNLRAESSLTLTCKVNSSEPISYSWTKNNLEMNSHHGVVFFDKIDHADKGAYFCTASNSFGVKRSNELQISINYLETPVINKVVKDGFIYLTCFAEGYPPPQHVWKLLEMNLTNNATLQVEISNSYKNEYECTAFNEYYTKSAFSTGIETYLSTPFVTVFPTGNINKGSAAVLTCSINGLKPLRYGWYKDNKILFGQYESMLLLESIQINDGGEYKCTVANNITSKTSKSRKLSVSYISGPEIGLSKVILNEGQNFSLPCRCFGNPNEIEYRWVKGVEDVVLSNTSMLVLQDVHVEDSGTYKCICKNHVSKSFQDLQVNINYLGLPSVYTTSSNTSKEGDSVKMYCLSNGTLPLTYKWKKNKSYIKHQGNVLFLHKVAHNDSGLYSCEVFNSVGSQVSNAVNLSVSFLTKPIILSKTEYVKGDTVNLTCISAGHPTVSFKWTKDNNLISLKHQLIIQNVDVEDEATFGCEVTNNIEVKTTFFILKVIYLDRPYLSISPSLSIEENHSAILSCSANGSQPIHYAWYKDNLHIFGNSNHILLYKVKRSDQGVYSCQTNNLAGMISSNIAFLIVTYLEEPVISKEEVVTDDQHLVILKCSAESYPKAVIVWLKQGILVAEGASFNLTNSGMIETDIVTCQASNGEYTKKITEIVQFDYFPTPIIKIFPTENIKRDSVVVLTCFMNGLKHLRYAWYKDDKLLFGQVESTLFFDKVQINDIGDYMCTAANNATIKKSNKRTLVVYYINPPELGLSKVTLKKGENVSIPCKCFGSPSDIEYKWVKGIERIVLSNTSTLMLQDVQAEDSGAYKCICKNVVMEIFQDVQIDVVYLGLPSVYTTSSNTSKEGDSVKMYCLSNGTLPLTYKWKKNKSYIKHQGNVLFLHKVAHNDSGLYSCEVFNSVGSQVSNAVNLSVSFLTKPIIISKVAYVNGDTVNLTCISAGHPTVLFKWTKDSKFFSLKHQLIIQNVDVKDEATYECQVTNNIETKSSFFSLKLIYLTQPHLAVTPSLRTEENHSALLSCTVNGSTPIDYIWYKDSARIYGHSNTIFFTELKRSDQGVYSCLTKNLAGTKSSNTLLLTVTYLEEPVVSKEELVTGDQHLIFLKCSVVSNPPATINWVIHNLTVAGPFFNLSNNGMIAFETVICQASNGEQTRERSELVLFHYLNFPWLHLRYKTEYNEGDCIELVCEVKGSEPLIFTWFHNGITLNENTYVLQLQNISRNQTGIYECLVQNQLMPKASQQEIVYIGYLDIPSIKIQQVLENSLILEGDTIIMECEVSGYPHPVVQWFKDGELIVNKSTLKLSSIQRQQGGVFVCSAYNRVGKEISTSLVKVHYMDAPILSLHGPLTLVSGSNLTIRCLVNCSSPLQVSYSWYKDGLLLPNTSYELILTYLEKKMSGVYTCHSKFDSFIKSSENNLSLIVKHFLPECGNNRMLVSQMDNWVCSCKDDFYGNDCEKKNHVVQARISIMRVCNQSLCYIGSALRDQLNINNFYIFLKQTFEEQMLSSFRAELREEYVVQVKWINFNFEDWLNVDYLVYFTNLISKSISQQQQLIQTVAVKYFYNRIQTKIPFSFQVIAKLTKVKDFDYCINNASLCDAHADCLNGLGTHYCRCRYGYAGDGIKCDPISSCNNDGQKQLLIFVCIVLSMILIALCIGHIVARIWTERKKKFASFAINSVPSNVFDVNRKSCLASILPEVYSYDEALEFYKKLENSKKDSPL